MAEVRAIDAVPWSTRITTYDEERVYYRGQPVDELVGSIAFSEALALLWTGRRPTRAEARVLDACLVAGMDHGAITPSASVARTAASVHQDPVAAVAAGLLAITPLHGGAVTPCMELLAEAGPEDPERWAQAACERRAAEGRRVPGIGHRVHTGDSRAAALIELAVRELGPSAAVSRVNALAAVVSERVGRPLPVNIDGATAAVLLALGMSPRAGNLVFAVSRMTGLAAHVLEERERERPMRLIDPTQVEYDGPDPREGLDAVATEANP